ncbi:MAG: alpha-amylase/4-alpha-glucanotransferase domain-containing protein [Anaerolineae bacterium]
MSKGLHLALAIHNHQPVGNFDHIFQEAFEKAYRPLVEALERHPGVRLALHYTGPLRDWLVAHRPDFLPRVRRLVERGQVEMMTGGYYEPILASIPDVDKVGQVRKLTETVWADFGCRATGAWLAERVWEPHLARPLAEAGVEYTIVDDTHFTYAGLEDEDLFGYYVTEEQGRTLKIFGTSKHLRYVIPWAPVEEVVGWLREQADESGTKVAVMGDDGEKFGLWPGTYVHCWQPAEGGPGWVERFFSALEESATWLHTIPPGEAATRFTALGRIYLPTASYDEMTEWALPARLSGEIVHLKHRLQEEGQLDVLRFLKGGFWRNFLVKYPEANTLHKKMLHVSRKAQRLTGSTPSSARMAGAMDHLWAGQCNCPYWHGVFGGSYLFHVRSANFAHLIQAETILDKMAHGESPWVAWETVDFDCDAALELLVSSQAQNLYFDLREGGSLFEWDWRERAINLLNVMGRRREGYHHDLLAAAREGRVALPGESRAVETIHTTVVRAREPGLENLLFEDWYRRATFLDHFFLLDETPEAFYRATFAERGDFVNQPYNHAVEESPGGLWLRLWREGGVWQGARWLPVRVEKRVGMASAEPIVTATYRVANLEGELLEARFGVETNWATLGGNGPQAWYQFPAGEREGLAARGQRRDLAAFGLVVAWDGWEAQVECEPAAEVWYFPLETVNNSEAGFERVYQGACVTPTWVLRLEPGQAWEARLRFCLRSSSETSPRGPSP